MANQPTRDLAAELLEEAQNRRATGNPSGAMARFQRCVEVLEALGESRWQAEIEREIGDMQLDFHELHDALNHYSSARNRFAGLGEEVEEALTIGRIGQVRYLIGDYAAAADQFREALARLTDSGNPVAEAAMSEWLGRTEAASRAG